MDPKVHVPPQFPGATSDATTTHPSDSGSRWIGPWWLPLAGVWTVVLRLRLTLYDWGILPSQKGALPTLVVGNVELGGTGKTPHVLDAVRRLQTWCGADAVGILSRGYGRKTSGFLWVSEAETWDQVGGRPRRTPEVRGRLRGPIGGLRRMAKDRPGLHGARRRTATPSGPIDGLGRPAVSVARLEWGALCGPWRDLPSRVFKASVAVDTTGQNPDLPLQSRAVASTPRCLHGNPVSDQLDQPTLLVTGIARPHRVLASAKGHLVPLAGVAHYPDHHPFSPSDLSAWVAWMKDHGVDHVLTTPKDAVRILPHAHLLDGLCLWTLSVHVEWETESAYNAFLESWASLSSQSNRILDFHDFQAPTTTLWALCSS